MCYSVRCDPFYHHFTDLNTAQVFWRRGAGEEPTWSKRENHTAVSLRADHSRRRELALLLLAEMLGPATIMSASQPEVGGQQALL